MDAKNPPTYNDLNFSKLSQALKSNILRRKTAKNQKAAPEKDENQVSQSSK
jgi:hypothetical protein